MTCQGRKEKRVRKKEKWQRGAEERRIFFKKRNRWGRRFSGAKKGGHLVQFTGIFIFDHTYCYSEHHSHVFVDLLDVFLLMLLVPSPLHQSGLNNG